jgi:hypothetical protein
MVVEVGTCKRKLFETVEKNPNQDEETSGVTRNVSHEILIGDCGASCYNYKIRLI